MAKVKGAASLKSAMRALANSPTTTEIDAAAIAALEPLRAETAALAPRVSLKRGVATRRRSARGRTFRQYWVGFKRGIAMRIAHLVEFGTQPHSLKKGASVRKGIFVGHAPMHPGNHPEPFFRPAFEHTKNDVIEGLGRRLWAPIQAAALRFGKRQ